MRMQILEVTCEHFWNDAYVCNLQTKLRRNKLEQHNGFMRKQLQSQNLFKIPVPVCGFFVKNENN